MATETNIGECGGCTCVPICDGSCSITGASISIAGFESDEVKYLEAQISGSVPSGYQCEDAPLADPSICTESGAGTSCLATTASGAEGIAHATQQCLMANINGTYSGGVITSTGPSTADVEHILGEYQNPLDRGVMISEEKLELFCCESDGITDCPGSPFQYATVYRRIYVYKISYGVTCRECAGGTNQWITPADAAGTVTVDFHEHGFYDYDFDECESNHLLGDPIGAESGTTYDGITSLGRDLATYFPVDDPPDCPGIGTYSGFFAHVVPPGYDEDCMTLAGLDEDDDCCVPFTTCFSCIDCGEECYGVTEFTTHPACDTVGFPPYNMTNCDGDPITVTGSISVY